MKNIVGALLFIIGICLICYGLSANDDNKSKETNNKNNNNNSTINISSEDTVIYDENNIKITVKDVKREIIQNTDTIYGNVEFENNNDQSYTIILSFKANNISNNVATFSKIVSANSKGTGEFRGYDNYFKHYDIKDLYNVNVDVFASNGFSHYTKNYKFDNTYIDEDKTVSLGNLVYSNDNVDIYYVKTADPYVAYYKESHKVTSILIKNKTNEEHNYLVRNDSFKVNGEVISHMCNVSTKAGEYGLEEIYFPYVKDVSTIDKIEFVIIEEVEETDENGWVHETRNVITDNVVINVNK